MRIASINQLQAVRNRLADGWNNTDHNYLRNQAVLITERMQQVQMPRDVPSYPHYHSGPWDTYEKKMRVLKDKLQLTFLSFPTI